MPREGLNLLLTSSLSWGAAQLGSKGYGRVQSFLLKCWKQGHHTYRAPQQRLGDIWVLRHLGKSLSNHYLTTKLTEPLIIRNTNYRMSQNVTKQTYCNNHTIKTNSNNKPWRRGNLISIVTIFYYLKHQVLNN
jgi:hypothetical protein